MPSPDVFSKEGQKQFKDHLSPDNRAIYDSLLDAGFKVRGSWFGRQLWLEILSPKDNLPSLTLTIGDDLGEKPQQRSWRVYTRS